MDRLSCTRTNYPAASAQYRYGRKMIWIFLLWLLIGFWFLASSIFEGLSQWKLILISNWIHFLLANRPSCKKVFIMFIFSNDSEQAIKKIFAEKWAESRTFNRRSMYIVHTCSTIECIISKLKWCEYWNYYTEKKVLKIIHIHKWGSIQHTRSKSYS